MREADYAPVELRDEAVNGLGRVVQAAPGLVRDLRGQAYLVERL
jgi:hypothetical protein